MGAQHTPGLEVSPLPPVRGNDARAFRKCTTHGNVGWYDYTPYSLSVPIFVMPCGCGKDSMTVISEDEFHAISGTPKNILADEAAIDINSFNAGWDACEFLWHGRVKHPEERRAAIAKARGAA